MRKIKSMIFGITQHSMDLFLFLIAGNLVCGLEEMNVTSLSLSSLVKGTYFVYLLGLLRRFVKYIKYLK